MKQHAHLQETTVASEPTRERYDNSVLQEWPRAAAPPRVFIGSLADYEAGLLHGRWVGVARPADEIRADVDAMLHRSPTTETTGIPARRWAVFDAEGFGNQQVDARTDLETLSQLGLRIKSFGGAFAAWARLHEHDLAGQLRFDRAYLGHYGSVRDYVEIYVDARNIERLAEAAVPPQVRPYIELNVAQLAADLIDYGDVLAVDNPDGGVWLFVGGQNS